MNLTGLKIFLRYGEDIARTVVGDHVFYQNANKLHPNLQFTVETHNENVDYAFLNIDRK